MFVKKKDPLKKHYQNQKSLEEARKVLEMDEQTEESFLGAQAILLLNDLL